VVRRSGILCGGTCTVDRNKRIDHWPREEAVAEILEEARCGGGPALNVSVALRGLSAQLPIEVIGVVGDDDDGRFVRATIRDKGMETSRLLTIDRAPTSFTEVMAVLSTGRRTFFHRPGVSAFLSPDHFDFEGTRARLLHVGYPGLHEIMDGPWDDDSNGWVTVLKRAKAAGLETNLEFASVGPERITAIGRPCLPYLDHLIVNDAEIGGLAGVETVRHGVTDVDACRIAAASVLAAGAMQTVIVHFPLGAVAISRDGSTVDQPSVAVPPVEIVASNGAGDAFTAGVLFAIHENWPLEKALELGHAAGAASLRSLSTTESVIDHEACLALADRWGWRRSFG
jgi:sugar/nucleoside kinase (ribokinase family)